jgi:uncharacterized protein (TIRG00374 family)
LRKYLKFIALLLLALLILWWFGRNLNWAEVRLSLSHADWRLLAVGAAIICAAYMVRAFRWRTLLSPITPASLRELFAATTIGFSAIFLLGRAGEVVRPVMLPLRDPRVRPGASFVTIMVERLCDMVAVALLFAFNLLWFPAPVGREAEFVYVRKAGLLLLVGIALGLFVLGWFKRSSKSFIPWLERKLGRLSFIPKRVRDAVTGLLENLASALSVFVNVRELAATAGWTALLWLSVMVTTWLVMRAFGLTPDFRDALFIMGWALVGSLVPTPGGAAGGFHATTKYGLTTFLGVEENQAAAIAIVMHLSYFAPALIFGIYYFLRSDISVARLRQLAAPEAVEHAVEEVKVAGLTEPELETTAAGK